MTNTISKVNILSKATDQPARIIRAFMKKPDQNGKISLVTLNYTALEYASHTLQLIVEDLKHPQTAVMFKVYGDASRMLNPLHATVYMLDKVLQDVKNNFSRNITTLMAMILDIKESKQTEEGILLSPAKRLVRDISRRMRDINKKINNFEAFPKKKQLRSGQKVYLATLLAEKQEIAVQMHEYIEIETNINTQYNLWRDYIDALEDDFWNACIVAIEQEMIEYLTNSQSSQNNYTVYQELQRLEDMFSATFGKRDLKAAVYKYMCSRITDMETNGKCEILKPFGNTFIRMLTGKHPCRSYIIPGVEQTEDVILTSGVIKKRSQVEMVLSQLRAMRDLTMLFSTKLMIVGIDMQLDELVESICKNNNALSKIDMDGLCTRLHGLAGVAYDLRYAILLINKLLRAGFYEGGTAVHAGTLRIIKSWIVVQVMRTIQQMAMECVDYEHYQLKYIIMKYAKLSGKSFPFTHLFRSLSIFHANVSMQEDQAEIMCKSLESFSSVKEKGLLKHSSHELNKFISTIYITLGFGGLASTSSISMRERQLRKAECLKASKKYDEYLSNYNYIWNLNDFSDNFGGIFMIQPDVKISPADSYMTYLTTGVRTGVWNIDHRERLCKFKYMLKYNKNIADLLKKFAPHPPDFPLEILD